MKQPVIAGGQIEQPVLPGTEATTNSGVERLRVAVMRSLISDAFGNSYTAANVQVGKTN